MTTSLSLLPCASWSRGSRRCLRRFERPSAPSVISFEEVVIDASAMQLKVRGELTTTTATEFRLLDYLARHPGRVFSRDHLLDAVWGDARFVTPRSVDVYVRRIREKIETDPENPRYLKTVRAQATASRSPRSANHLVTGAVRPDSVRVPFPTEKP